MTEPRPFVWQMIRRAVGELGGETTNVAVRDWILQNYPGTNISTIQAQIVVLTVNHPSRVHYPENRKPRAATSQYDFLFRIGRGRLALYDPEKHGQWAIEEDDGGRLKVAELTEHASDDGQPSSAQP
jgi:hypothetical protein